MNQNFNSIVRKEELKQLLIEKQKIRGLEDLHYFDKNILGYVDMTKKEGFHGEMCGFVEDESQKFNLLLEPRGSLKSSVVTIGYTLRQIVKYPNIRVLMASEEFATAKKFLSELKGHVEKNPKFRSLYGDLVSDEKWSEAEIITSNRTLWRKEPTVTCAGIDVTKVGMHYDLIIIDDPHSSKNITTREQLEKVITWYRLVLSLLDPQQSKLAPIPLKLVVIGTRWHYDDLSGWLIGKERERQAAGLKRRYRVLKKTAVRGKLDLNTPASRLLWPERLSKEFLMDQLLDQGPYIFSCQYRNRPVDDESAKFKRSWVQFYEPNDPAILALPKYTVMDPARDEDGKDYTSLVTVAMDSDWVNYVLEVRRGKWNEWDTLDQLIRCHQRWKQRKIGVESVAWQKTYYRFFKAELLRQNRRVPIVELKTDTRVSKKMRINSMVPYWRNGYFRVPGHSVVTLQGNMAIMIDELLRYPRVSNEDCIDALAYMDQLTHRPQISKIKKPIPPGSFIAVRNRIAKPKPDKLGVYNRV